MFNWKFESNLTFSKRWLNKLKLLVSKHNLLWMEPLHNTSYDNEEVFEWWFENRKLTIYIDNKKVEYIKVWGTDIDTEMANGLVMKEGPNDILHLFEWLTRSND